MQYFQGKSVYKGIVMGPVAVLKKNDYQVKRARIEDPEAEVKRVKEAVEVSKKQLGRLYDKAVREVGEASAAIFEVHQMMLEDEDYLESMENMIRIELVNAEYADPSTCLSDTKTLFAEFGLDWGWTSAQGAAKDQDIRFVPIPRDDKADKYYTNTDTFGYLVPAGAKNIKAAIKYMEICRLNEIDPELIAKSKAEMTAEHLYYPKCPECGVSTPDKTLEKCPSCGATRRENKKHSAMSEDLYQIYTDLKDTTSDKFTFLFDDCFGFSTDLTNMLQQGDSEGKGCVLGGPFKFGESYTNLRDSYYGTVESFLEPYRALMQKS